MRIDALNCNHCGAPLSVPESANFVTCGHCQTQLVIRRTDSVTYSEQLNAIDRRTEHLSEQVAQLTYRSELDQIDKQWEQERQSYMRRDKHGNAHPPSTAGALIAAIILGVFGAILISSGSGFGFLLIPIGVGAGVWGYFQAQQYNQAERRYRERRARVNADDFRQPAAGTAPESSPGEFLDQLGSGTLDDAPRVGQHEWPGG